MKLNYFLSAIAALAMLAGCEEISRTVPDDGDEDIENPENPGGTEDPDPDTPDPDEPDPDEPETFYYQEVTSSLDNWEGDYLITYTASGNITVFDSWSDSTYGQSKTDLHASMTEDGIPSETGDPYKAIIGNDGEGYTIYVSNVGYIGFTENKNSLSRTADVPSASDKAFHWTISFGTGIHLVPMSATGRELQWNASAPRFACYTGSQKSLTLYRRTVSDGKPGTSPENPGPVDPVDPEEPDPDQPDPDEPGDYEPLPNNAKYGWYELPVMNVSSNGRYIIDSSDSDIYFAHHLCAGPEKDPNGKQARNYTVCFSAKHHCPVWVAAPRHTMYETKGCNRTDAYAADPDIPSSIQYSSKSTGGDCNKGHMLGSAERICSDATNRQVFYYSNIAPQRSATFNTGGGGWNTLEDWVDTQVCSDTLYVVIGTYFDSYTDKRGYSDSPATISFGGRNDVSRPTMFYYILMRTKAGNSGKPLSKCSASEIKCAAFVRSHKTPTKVSVSSQDLMSVSDLEKITGFTYFANVPQAPKDTYSASDWGL